MYITILVSYKISLREVGPKHGNLELHVHVPTFTENTKYIQVNFMFCLQPLSFDSTKSHNTLSSPI